MWSEVWPGFRYRRGKQTENRLKRGRKERKKSCTVFFCHHTSQTENTKEQKQQQRHFTAPHVRADHNHPILQIIHDVQPTPPCLSARHGLRLEWQSCPSVQATLINFAFCTKRRDSQASPQHTCQSDENVDKCYINKKVKLGATLGFDKTHYSGATEPEWLPGYHSLPPQVALGNHLSTGPNRRKKALWATCSVPGHDRTLLRGFVAKRASNGGAHIHVNYNVTNIFI